MKSWSAEPWHGQTKIILGIDLGTTQSAVSFAHLFDGAPQTVQYVTKWPAQPDYSKIPTVVYYDQNRKAVCFGAEAFKQENRDRAEEEGWFLAKHFKLLLHPKSLQTEEKLTLPKLPPDVPLSTVYTDFLRYLLQHTQSYFEKHVIGGDKEWKEHSPNMLVVLSHPNGWSTPEQHFMREALRNIGESYQSCKVRFVTEAEASVHFCMFHSGLSSSLQPNTELVVCDAGGSTVDTTVYSVQKTAPVLQLEERKASACRRTYDPKQLFTHRYPYAGVQAGGIFVDRAVESHLTGLLSEASIGLSKEEVKDYVRAGVEDFEAGIKKEFAAPDTGGSIDLRDPRLKVPTLKISRGRVPLTGSTLKEFFDQAVIRTTQSVSQQIEGLNPKHFLLVGGFGQSEYLRRAVQNEFTFGGCQVTVIDANTSKAAADGAVIWAAKLAVQSRITRVAYGTEVLHTYEPSNPEHSGRKVVPKPSGQNIVEGGWSMIVDKGVSLSANESRQYNYHTVYPPGDIPTTKSNYIWICRGDSDKTSGWLRDKNGNVNPGFETLCELKADLSKVAGALERKQGPDGPYDQLEFSIVIEFGGTELAAWLQWIENGITRSGPVSIIPELVDHPSE